MINREAGLNVPGVTAVQKLYTCSTGDIASGAAINGRVIDRLGLGGARIYEEAGPFIHVYSTAGSTAADQRVTLSIKLQHGDSSGGGDMADYSTGMTPADQNFRTTAESTAYQNWSTGTQFWNHQGYYNVVAAKRYVRAVGVWTRGGSTTSTAAGSADVQNAWMGIRFGKPDVAPISVSSSTSTSTST